VIDKLPNSVILDKLEWTSVVLSLQLCPSPVSRP